MTTPLAPAPFLIFHKTGPLTGQGELGREEEAPWAAAAVLQSRSRKPSPHSKFLTSVDIVSIQHFRHGSFLQP